MQTKSLKEILLEQNHSLQKRIQDFLVDNEPLNDEQLAALLLAQEVIGEFELFKAYAVLFDIPYVENLKFNEINPQLVKNLNISFCMHACVVPVLLDDYHVTIAINNPYDEYSIEFLRIVFNKNVKRVLCQKSVIEAAINNLFERVDTNIDGKTEKGLIDDEAVGIEGLDVAHDLLHDVEEAPVRKEVTIIIRRGITEKASDIHIEPFEDRVSVRFRLDGRMREVRVIPKKYQSSVATRIKILAKLNIAESRLPQDGRITLKVGARDIDVRVSTLPIKYGERIVLRILDKSSGLPALEKMGMPENLMKEFIRLIQQKHGIVLVTGPTGSGKTTTLAAALMYINKPDVSIITVEDPVEVQLPGVSQVEVNEKAGLTFAAALRSILRQNPNIILIGEIRDAETASIAVQASITGHLVFSTLHTNDTAATVTRLVDFGIEPFQITTAVNGVLAVRLMRKVCLVCRVETKYSEEQLNTLGVTPAMARGKTLYKINEAGCNHCKNTGYSGRMGVYELLVFDDPIRDFILKTSDGASLKRFCISRGMVTLRASVQERFLKGETTLDEALYVTQSETQDTFPVKASASEVVHGAQ